MTDWEQAFVDLIHDCVEKLPSQLTDDQLIFLRTYIGRELTNRTLKEKSRETTA